MSPFQIKYNKKYYFFWFLKYYKILMYVIFNREN